VRTRRNSDELPPERGKPASTSEGRDNQLISLAMDLAAKQMREGTASAQVITHYLKMGSPRERLEQERLVRENELLREKVESLSSAKRMEELYEQAIAAMRTYSGQKPVHGGDYDDPDVF
jgi:microsomal dipeptidase-like Zn-dependent dipeptidase